jgi:hypothetical protein
MGTHIVEIWNEKCEVGTDRMSKTVWRASGSYMGEYHQVTDRTEGTALKRWREWATYKGG